MPELVEKYRAIDVTSYLSEAESRRLTCQADMRAVLNYVSRGRILDIGCSAGIFLSCVPDSFSRFGIEPGHQGAMHARRAVGHDAVHEGTDESACFDD
jgi:hypothetical protein